MATNKILYEYGTQLIFADHATDFVYPATDPLAANNISIGTPTEVQMNFSVISNGAGWGSAKTSTLVDTGDAWPLEWQFGAVMEGTATPTEGSRYDFYWAPSPNSTAGNGNPGGITGTDASQTVTGNALDQLIFIGSLVCRANVININPVIGKIVMPYIYGSLVMVNNSGVAMVADADADNCYVVATPLIPHIQAAA